MKIGRGFGIFMICANLVAALMNSLYWFAGQDSAALLVLFNLAMAGLLSWQITHYRHLQKYPPPPSIRCPVCGRISYNPNDIREGYCGYCHAWTH